MPTSTSARIPHPGGRIALWFYLGQIPYLPRGSEVQKEKCSSTPDDPVQKELRKSQSHILTGQERKGKAPSKKIVILFHRKVHGLTVNQSYDHIPIKKTSEVKRRSQDMFLWLIPIFCGLVLLGSYLAQHSNYKNIFQSTFRKSWKGFFTNDKELYRFINSP